MSAPTGTVQKASQNGICTITFGHPKSNCLPKQLLLELTKNIEEAGKAEDVHIIILSSDGDKNFCAGASFDELLTIDSIEKGKEFFEGFATLMLAMKSCPKFIIGRILGKSVGGGIGVIAATDYAFATIDSSIRLSELSIGIGPFTIAPAVQRKIGIAAFHELTISTTWRSAEWAHQKGLFQKVVSTSFDLNKEINAFIATLSHFNKDSMRITKEFLWKDAEHWDTLLFEGAAISANLVLSPATQEMIRSLQGSQA